MGDINIEPIARAICEREVRRFPNTTEDEVPALVDRYWQVIAAQIVAGLRDDDGKAISHTAATGIAAWEAWLDERQ